MRRTLFAAVAVVVLVFFVVWLAEACDREAPPEKPEWTEPVNEGTYEFPEETALPPTGGVRP